MQHGETIRSERQRKGLTQKELADLLGVSPEYVSLIESGKRPLSVKMKYKICQVLGVELTPGAGNKITPIVTHGSATIPYYRHYIHAGIKGAHVLDDEVEQFNINEHYANTAAYEVAGDSMEGADIRDGDRLVVRLGHRFKQDDIILCRFNGELMVKGARIVNDAIWLLPMNDKYHAWECKETDQLEVIGTVIEVIRKPDIAAVKRKPI